MLCYRDMTFCGYYKHCNEPNCSRKLTREVILQAKEIRFPICQFDHKPDCFNRIIKEKP